MHHWTLSTAALSAVRPTDNTTTAGAVIDAGSAEHLEQAATDACAAALAHFQTHAETNPGGAPVVVTIDGAEIITGPAYNHAGAYHHAATTNGLDELRHTITSRTDAGRAARRC